MVRDNDVFNDYVSLSIEKLFSFDKQSRRPTTSRSNGQWEPSLLQHWIFMEAKLAIQRNPGRFGSAVIGHDAMWVENNFFFTVSDPSYCMAQSNSSDCGMFVIM